MGPFGSNIKVDCFVDSGVPVLNGSNLQGYKLNETSFNYVTVEKADSLGRANAGRGDVVITHRGTLGQIVYIPQDSQYDRYVISQSQFRIRLKEAKVNPAYLVNFFHTRLGLHILLSNASQVGVPAIARPTTSFKSLKVQLPSLRFQNRVVSILSSLDAKIELNRRINDNLEQQAQELFDLYFDCRSEYLEGATRGYLTDIASYLNGLAMQKFPATDIGQSLPVLKIKELGQHKCDDSSDRCSNCIDDDYIVNNGDIIFSWSGTLLVDVWCGGKCGLNQHLFKVTPLKDYPQWFVYYWTNRHLKNFKLIAKDKAVTMGHIKRGDLEKAEVLIPTEKRMLEINAQIAPLFQSIIGRRLEISNIENLRDTLLPRLMSGELRISETKLGK